MSPKWIALLIDLVGKVVLSTYILPYLFLLQLSLGQETLNYVHLQRVGDISKAILFQKSFQISWGNATIDIPLSLTNDMIDDFNRCVCLVYGCT